jgi:hypothetical protein
MANFEDSLIAVLFCPLLSFVVSRLVTAGYRRSCTSPSLHRLVAASTNLDLATVAVHSLAFFARADHVAVRGLYGHAHEVQQGLWRCEDFTVTPTRSNKDCVVGRKVH